MRRRVAVTAVLALAALLQPASAQPGRPGSPMILPPRVEIRFSLEAEVASAALDAQVEAGGRLLARRRHRPGGPQTLSLLHPLEHPWKLFAVDPAGPAGDEVKLAAVVTLPEGSWKALEEARGEIDRFGEEAYRRWAERSGARRPFDGAFAFVVIGPPQERFRAEVGADGRLTAVTNRLTDRWLGEDFDRLAKDWQAAEREGARPPEGYWFWNRGEPEPPPWEPRTYHAFARALALLDLPVFPRDSPEAAAGRGAGAAYEVELPDAAGRAREVLETLAPKTRGRLAGAGPVVARFTVTEVTEARLEVEGEEEGARLGSGRDAATLAFHRRLVYDLGRGLVESDEVRLSLTTRGGRLTVEAGYRPAGEERRSVPSP